MTFSARLSSYFVLAVALAAPSSGAPWRAIGPWGGYVVSFTRCQSQPSVVLVQGYYGGIHRSNDGGRTWQSANGDLPQRRLGELAIDPKNPDSYWLTTADFGLFHTVDRGEHWRPIAPPAPGAPTLAISPDSTTLLLGNSAGLFRSRDGGGSWQRLARGFPAGYGVVSVAFDAFDPKLAYAAVRGAYYGVYTTRNQGKSWQRVLPAKLWQLRADPHAPGVVVSRIGQSVVRSLDAGATWQTIASDPEGLNDFSLGTGSPSDILYLASHDIFDLVFSVDGRSGAVSQLPATIDNLTPSVLSADPRQKDAVLVGGYYGLVRTSDGGGTWPRSDRGFSGTEAAAITVLDRTSFLVGNSRTTDGGSHWDTFLPDQFVITSTFSPSDRQTIFAAASRQTLEGTDDGVWTSHDAGVTWSATSAGLNRSSPFSLAVDPAIAGRVFLATATSGIDGDSQGGLYRSDDGAAHWQAIADAENAGSLEFDHSHPACLYLLNRSAIRRSCDAAATWTTLLDSDNPIAADAVFADLALAPSDPRFIYAVEGYSSEPSRLWRSTDRGETFTTLDLPAAAIAASLQWASVEVDPRAADVIYLAVGGFGSDGGMWRRRGDGPWEDLSTGLWNLAVRSLHIEPGPRPRLFASTGAGVQMQVLEAKP